MNFTGLEIYYPPPNNIYGHRMRKTCLIIFILLIFFIQKFVVDINALTTCTNTCIQDYYGSETAAYCGTQSPKDTGYYGCTNYKPGGTEEDIGVWWCRSDLVEIPADQTTDCSSGETCYCYKCYDGSKCANECNYNFKVELSGDYDRSNENSLISIDGNIIGYACNSSCELCSWDFALTDNIDIDSYCSDDYLIVTFNDSAVVSADCNANHRACIYENNAWHCCENQCNDNGCENSVRFNCDRNLECDPIPTTTTTTITTTTTFSTTTSSASTTTSLTTTTSTAISSTTTSTTSSTTTTIPDLTIICDECIAENTCQCNLTKRCDSGKWILQNKEKTPLTAIIDSKIPPNITNFIPINIGRVSVTAVCRSPEVISYETEIEVKPRLLKCPKTCVIGEDCECSVIGCNDGLFIAKDKENNPLNTTIVDKVVRATYTNSFKTNSTGKIKVEVFCFKPFNRTDTSEIDIISIPENTTTTTTSSSTTTTFLTTTTTGDYTTTTTWATTTTTQIPSKEVCPYECCEDEPDYTSKYCPIGLECCDNECKESCEPPKKSGKGILIMMALVIVLVIVFFIRKRSKTKKPVKKPFY